MALLPEGIDELGLGRANSTPGNDPGYFMSNGAYVCAREEGVLSDFTKSFTVTTVDGKISLEYATPGTDDPRWAAASIVAGGLIMPQLVAASSRRALYLRNDPDRDPDYDRGFSDIRFLVASRTCHLYTPQPELGSDALHPVDRAFGSLFGSFLSTLHLITGAGMVGDGYQISQRALQTDGVVGMAGDSLDRPIKPMYYVHHPPRYNRHDYVVEVRNQDSPQSPIATFLGTGLQSAFLRCLWYGERSHSQSLPVFENPVKVLHESNAVSAIHQKHPLLGKFGPKDPLSIVEALQMYLGYMEEQGSRIGLSASEMDAIRMAQGIVTTLHEVRDHESAQSVAEALDWAARLTVMRSRIGEVIVGENIQAVTFDFQWDRRMPRGYSQEHWDRIDTEQAVPRWMIDHCRTKPQPGTRSEQIVQRFLELQQQGYSPQVGWNHIVYEGPDGRCQLLFDDPTGKAPPTYLKL